MKYVYATLKFNKTHFENTEKSNEIKKAKWQRRNKERRKKNPKYICNNKAENTQNTQNLQNIPGHM